MECWYDHMECSHHWLMWSSSSDCSTNHGSWLHVDQLLSSPAPLAVCATVRRGQPCQLHSTSTPRQGLPAFRLLHCKFRGRGYSLASWINVLHIEMSIPVGLCSSSDISIHITLNLLQCPLLLARESLGCHCVILHNTREGDRGRGWEEGDISAQDCHGLSWDIPGCHI